MSHNNSQLLLIYKWLKDDFHHVDDNIATESPLEIRLGQGSEKFQNLATTMCSPADIQDLVMGYLYTENIIKKSDDVITMEVFDNEMGLVAEVLLSQQIDVLKYLKKRQSLVHASCGICGKTNFDDLLVFKYRHLKPAGMTLTAELICSLPAKLNQAQQAFQKTGGLHASALFNSQGELLLIKEDIGRHNALDKLIGAALEQGLLPLTDNIIVLSGRVSFELVHKSLMAGAMTLCAIGAPSSLSIEIAQTNGMNLIGFTQASTYNQYTNFETNL